MSCCIAGFAASGDNNWRRTAARLQRDSAGFNGEGPNLKTEFDGELGEEMEGACGSELRVRSGCLAVCHREENRVS